MIHRTGYIPRDYKSFPLGADPVRTKEWDLPLLSRAEAKERAEYLIAHKLDPLSQAIKHNAMPTFQNGFGYCWAHAATMLLKLIMAMSGVAPPRLSATAMAAKIKGYRDRGGNAFEAFPFMAEHGVPSVEFWPENKVDKSLDTPDMRADAQTRLALEWYELPDRSDEHKWTALCYGFPLWSGYSNIGHAMASARYVDNGQPTSLDINSWHQGAAEASQWQDRWLDDRNVIWQRGGRDFTSFEQYAIRVSTVTQ